MAAKYRKVDPRIWRDEKFVGLDAIDKLIVLYVLTSLQANRIGLFTFSVALAAEELGIKVETFRERFANVCQTFHWPYEPRTKSLFLKTWWKYNRPDNPNMLKGCLEDLHDLPASELITVFLANTRYLPETFAAVLGNVGGNVGGNVTPQEQEQEQEMEQELEGEHEGEEEAGGGSSPPAPPACSPPLAHTPPAAPRSAAAPQAASNAAKPRAKPAANAKRPAAMSQEAYTAYYDRQARAFLEVAGGEGWPRLQAAGWLEGEVRRLRTWALTQEPVRRKADIAAYLRNNLNRAEKELDRRGGGVAGGGGGGGRAAALPDGGVDLGKIDYVNGFSGFKHFDAGELPPEEEA